MLAVESEPTSREITIEHHSEKGFISLAKECAEREDSAFD